MVWIIVICIVVFIFVVLLFNYQNIVDKIKSKRNSKKPKEEKPAKSSKNDSINMGEDLVQKKVDELKHKPVEEVTVEPFVMADESELKELEAKSSHSGGRRSGDIKTISNIDVQVEELDDGEQIQTTSTSKNTVAEQIKNLPPEIKALLLSDLLDKKE